MTRLSEKAIETLPLHLRHQLEAAGAVDPLPLPKRKMKTFLEALAHKSKPPKQDKVSLAEIFAGLPKPSKYKNKKCEIDGIVFDSHMEGKYYSELKLMGVKGLKLQVRFPLQESFTKNGKHFRDIEYVADFVYDEGGKKRVIDVKGVQTPLFKLKRKLFEYKYPNLTLETV